MTQLACWIAVSSLPAGSSKNDLSHFQISILFAGVIGRVVRITAMPDNWSRILDPSTLTFCFPSSEGRSRNTRNVHFSLDVQK